ncbi:hypothetical protein EDC01DRAFT_666049 [Geopyxis carbonaria]|nr:hypothetical protein EDC01DRAFT_666049 [Geopyxis carbonaria]
MDDKLVMTAQKKMDPKLSNDTYMMFGQIDLANSFTLDDYAARWWQTRNLSNGGMVTGTAENVIFDAGLADPDYPSLSGDFMLGTFDPSTRRVVSNISLPETLPETLGLRMFSYSTINIRIPEQNASYHMGAMRGIAQFARYDIPTDTWKSLPAQDKVFAAGAFVPVGEKGVIMMIGGNDQASTETAVPLDQINIFDVATETWRRQSTSGRTPPPRIFSCAGVASAPDGSSHQVHIYGGVRPVLTPKQPDIKADTHWILSIPSFTWYKAPSGRTRQSHNCPKLDERKMLIVGGYEDVETSTCTKTIEILDLSTLEMVDSYGRDEDYSVPELVYSVIGGGPAGGAALTSPKAGYDSGVERLLSKPYSLRTWADAPSGSGGNGTTDGEKSKTPVIAGATVGGVVGLALIAGGLFFCLRRRRGSTPADGDGQEQYQYQPAALAESDGTELKHQVPPVEMQAKPDQIPVEMPGGHVVAELRGSEPVYPPPPPGYSQQAGYGRQGEGVSPISPAY